MINGSGKLHMLISAMRKTLLNIVRDNRAGQLAANPGLMRQLLGKAIVALAPGWKLLDVGWHDKRGSVALITAMLSVVLIGCAALAVDVSMWEGNIGTMQGAADQAALAAGQVMSAGNAAAQKEAKGVAAAHGFLDGTGNVGVRANIPPVAGSYVSNANAIEVVITQPQTISLSGVFLKSPPTASVRAVAVPASASTCLLLLAPTGKGITNSGNGAINAQTCNIYVNSKDACDVYIPGIGDITGFDVFLGEQNQAGCTPGLGQAVAKNKLQFGAAPALDPYALREIPIPSTPCKKIDTSPTQINLTKGTYCGLKLIYSQSVNLVDSGVYIFDGQGIDNGVISASGNNQITGTNVTLVLTSSGSNYGGITLSGNVILKLTPMTSGPTAGMAIWLNQAGAMPLVASGNNNLNITGAIYAPGSTVTWSGNVNSPCLQLIAYRMTLPGNAATFQHKDCSGLGVKDVSSAAGYKLLE